MQHTQYIIQNEDVVGAAPTGDAPTTSELSTILLPTKARLIPEVLRYVHTFKYKVIHSKFKLMKCTRTKL